MHVGVLNRCTLQIECTTSYYTLTVLCGAVTVAEQRADAALGPDGDFSALQIEGDERLASVLLVGVGAGVDVA